VCSLAYDDDAPGHPPPPSNAVGTIEHDNAITAVIETDLLAKLRWNIGTADRGRTRPYHLDIASVCTAHTIRKTNNDGWADLSCEASSSLSPCDLQSVLESHAWFVELACGSGHSPAVGESYRSEAVLSARSPANGSVCGDPVQRHQLAAPARAGAPSS
jgi:hypothetical protein